MACHPLHLGFREVVIDHSSLIQWRLLTIDTGAAQSTLQDIKVPEYGGCYMYKHQSASTQNRYIFWRVCHDIVEMWEESLDVDFQFNHIQLRFADTPILEGLSIHETHQHVVILLATVSSIHRIRLPHPAYNSNLQHSHSVFRDVTYQSLRECHNQHVLNSTSAGEGLPHTAATYLVANGIGKGDAVFILGQSKGALMMATMTAVPYSVHFNVIKTASFINRIFTGFVPTMFRGMEGGETVSSLVLEHFKGEVIAFGISFDGRLRAWSCTKLECVLSHNVLENTAEAGAKLSPGAQRHLIRSCSSGDTTYLSVFLSFVEKQLILIFIPCHNMGQLSVQLIKTLYPPQFDIVDLAVTSSYVWSLWIDASNETKLLYSPVAFNGGCTNTPGWKEVILEPCPEKDIPLTDQSIDPAEAFLKELLAPNRFSALTLQKALGIYRRQPEGGVKTPKEEITPLTGLWTMAEEVESALREEIEAGSNTDLMEEEIADIKINAWTTFYSHTLQYHQVARKAIGIVGVGAGGLVAVMRKQSVSWIRPLDALELLLLASRAAGVGALASTPILSDDAAVAASVVALALPLRAVRAALEPDVAAAFCLDLFHLEPPDQVAASIATALLSESCSEVGVEGVVPLSRTLTAMMSGVPGVVAGLEAYLRALELDLGNPDALTLDQNAHGETPTVNGTFASRLGCSLVAAVVAQLGGHRLQLCRDLLLLQQMMLLLNLLTPESKNKVHATLLPQTTLLTQAYYALTRLSTAPATRPSSAHLEASRRQMAALALNDSATPVFAPTATNTTPRFSTPPTLPTHFPPTVLELFVLSSGGTQARALLSATLEEDGRSGCSWAGLLMPLATTVAQLAWPMSRCLALAEFLVWGNQHGAVLEHVRLLRPWCEWNSCSRQFLLAVSLLKEGEARKGFRLFLAALEGVATEEFVGVRVAGGQPDTPLEEAQVQYCLKVIRLLEQSGHVGLALEMAKAGLALAPVGDPGLSALYSVAFKYHLELGHHDEAFTALMACQDPHRRRNCLRQLVIALYERRCLSSLISYKYGALESEVITILENRARSADILVVNYYDLLFAFHINKHNFKKAAWVMYECALRLNREGLGERGLHQQAKCFLACINCLRHIPQDQAWILKPIGRPATETSTAEEEEQMEDEDDVLDSPGHRLRKLIEKKKKPQIQVLEISDLEREYKLVHARLKLFKVHPSPCMQLPGGPMSASDTTSLLTHGKLFRDALKLCHLFGLPATPILQGLAAACIEADLSDDKAKHWHWLSENGVLRDTCEGAGWWSLLRQLLTEEEKGQQSHLHKAVVEALLERGHPVPAWLFDSYKKRNCGELLRLLLTKGLLEEAASLVTALLDALLGLGTEQMGLESALHVTSSPVCLPYNAIDHLVLELKDLHSQPHYKKIYSDLKQKIEKYQAELQRVSYDKLLIMAEN